MGLTRVRNYCNFNFMAFTKISINIPDWDSLNFIAQSIRSVFVALFPFLSLAKEKGVKMRSFCQHNFVLGIIILSGFYFPCAKILVHFERD